MAAKAITSLPEWQTLPKIWGTRFIEKTSDGLDDRISTGPKANAARVNLHLYMQSHFEEEIRTLSTDEPWVDTI